MAARRLAVAAALVAGTVLASAPVRAQQDDPLMAAATALATRALGGGNRPAAAPGTAPATTLRPPAAVSGVAPILPNRINRRVASAPIPPAATPAEPVPPAAGATPPKPPAAPKPGDPAPAASRSHSAARIGITPAQRVLPPLTLAPAGVSRPIKPIEF